MEVGGVGAWEKWKKGEKGKVEKKERMKGGKKELAVRASCVRSAGELERGRNGKNGSKEGGRGRQTVSEGRREGSYSKSYRTYKARSFWSVSDDTPELDDF